MKAPVYQTAQYRVAASVLAMLIAGCAGLTSPDYLSRLRFEDGLEQSALHDGIYVSTLTDVPTADGTLKVGVSVGSTLGMPIGVRYKVYWYDQNGLLIHTSVSNWEHLNLQAQGQYDFTFVGPGPQAVRYLIEWQYD
jgi:uncharacterized protein YcfL